MPKSTVSESGRSKIECWQSDILPTWVERDSNDVLGLFERTTQVRRGIHNKSARKSRATHGEALASRENLPVRVSQPGRGSVRGARGRCKGS